MENSTELSVLPIESTINKVVTPKCTNKRRSRSSSGSYSRSSSSSRDEHNYLRKKSRHHRSSRRHNTSRYSRSHSRSPSHNSHRRRRYFGSREDPQKSRCLGVFGLCMLTSERKLLELFTRFGELDRVSVVYDAKTGRSRGFAFVYYKHSEHASLARSECNGILIDEKRIRVDYSITQRAHTPTPGVYMGSQSGRNRSRSRDHSRRRHRHRHRHHRTSSDDRYHSSQRHHHKDSGYGYSRSRSR
ncbi:unnamed protein product [Diamesa serratosioi]